MLSNYIPTDANGHVQLSNNKIGALLGSISENIYSQIGNQITNLDSTIQNTENFQPNQLAQQLNQIPQQMNQMGLPMNQMGLSMNQMGLPMNQSGQQFMGNKLSESVNINQNIKNLANLYNKPKFI